MSEVKDFEQVYKVVIDFVKKDKYIFVIVIVDYIIGGFVIGVNGKKNWYVELIFFVKKMFEFMVKKISEGKLVKDVFVCYINLKFILEEIKSVEVVVQVDNSKGVYKVIIKIFNI